MWIGIGVTKHTSPDPPAEITVVAIIAEKSILYELTVIPVGGATSMVRKIIHCDADCFFAAIEMRDNPSYRNRPLAVGGSPGGRGVLSTCNYQARQYGLHSAMPSAQAMKLCPDLLIVPHNMEKYKQASAQMREIFLDYTDLVEPLSLDEAYLDVSDSDRHSGSATRIAEEIRQRVQSALNITVSAGVSNSKFLAKIASDWRKPDNLFVIPPTDVDAFVAELPVSKIHGVGKVTATKLASLGINTCADLRRFGLPGLVRHFGVFGPKLYELSQGIDKRQVKPQRIRKSLSVEHTYSQDLTSAGACLEKLPGLVTELKRRLQSINDSYCVAKAFVKVKFSDFTTTTLERAGTTHHMDSYQPLMQEALERQASAVRLLGVGVRFKALASEGSVEQLELFNLESA